MYELKQEIFLPIGSVSHFQNNLSLFFQEDKNSTLACMVHKNQIGTLSWDQSLNNFTFDTLPVKYDDFNTPITIIQAKYCMPSCRSQPLLVVATSRAVLIYDAKSCTLLTQKEIDQKSAEATGQEKTCHFTKGITIMENLIAVGSYSGELLLFACSGENSVNFKKSVQEHDFAIADLATCRLDDLTCSCDVSGNITVWAKNFKNAQKKINTGHEINCINVLRKQVIVGTFTGQLLFYSTFDGRLLAEINAHIRQINAIAVAPESAYIISVSEDTMLRLWKLHTRKSETFKIEWRYNERIENMPLVGVQFTNGCGNGFIVAAYDYAKLLYYRVAKKPS